VAADSSPYVRSNRRPPFEMAWTPFDRIGPPPPFNLPLGLRLFSWEDSYSRFPHAGLHGSCYDFFFFFWFLFFVFFLCFCRFVWVLVGFFLTVGCSQNPLRVLKPLPAQASIGFHLAGSSSFQERGRYVLFKAASLHDSPSLFERPPRSPLIGSCETDLLFSDARKPLPPEVAQNFL